MRHPRQDAAAAAFMHSLGLGRKLAVGAVDVLKEGGLMAGAKGHCLLAWDVALDAVGAKEAANHALDLFFEQRM
jgi:hypothetical protein